MHYVFTDHFTLIKPLTSSVARAVRRSALDQRESRSQSLLVPAYLRSYHAAAY